MNSWVNCTRCGNRYQSFISSCPQCGYSNSSQCPDRITKGSGAAKKWALVGGVSVVALIAAAFIILGNSAFLSSSGVAVSDKTTATTISTPASNVNADKSPSSSNPSGSSTGQQAIQAAESSNARLDELKQYALAKINDDRAKFGLKPVLLSDNSAAQLHADDMLATRKLSHWTTDGMKPYMRYTINGGTYTVAQNAAMQFSEGNDKLGDFRLDLCKANDFFCSTQEIKNALDTLEHEMMYNDKECCNDGHRENILDKQHTHVSIGIAYNSYEITYIQNFEDHYVSWSQPIVYNQDSDMVVMSGTLTSGMELDSASIVIAYDPLPSPATYDQHRDDKFYSLGDFVATVVKPPPPGYIYQKPADGHVLIQADKWKVNGQTLDISFSMKQAREKYGNGVYTVVLFAKDENGGNHDITNASIFIK